MKSGSFHSKTDVRSRGVWEHGSHDEYLGKKKMTERDFSGSRILLCFCGWNQIIVG